MRQFSHVEAHIPLSAKAVPPDVLENLTSRTVEDAVVAEFAEPPVVENEALSEWMTLINSKLDAILHILTLQREGFSSLPMRHVLISGGGISFITRTEYQPGDTLEIKLVLPSVSPLALYIYGKVESVEKLESGNRVGVEFISMDETVRDKIVDFVFRRERDILREKHEEGY
ncbi:MAG: PilZ domain-containing protein [Nitrospinae bacterium]|nr:PilZ domain-containing protein [Nitrospinota bacterium]